MVNAKVAQFAIAMRDALEHLMTRVQEIDARLTAREQRDLVAAEAL